MFVDEQGKFISQREEPRLAQVKVAVDQNLWSQKAQQIDISFGGDKFKLDFDPQVEQPLATITLWGQEYQAATIVSPLTVRLSEFLEKKIALVQVHQCTRRAVSKKHQGTEALTAFADGYPLLALFSASLDDLNSRLNEKVGFDRFRGNVIVDNSGDPPFGEDQVKKLAIGTNSFTLKPCSRCVIVNIDQDLGVRQLGGEPLKTLGKFRNFDGRINFGVNLVHQGVGELSEGDLVTW
jgi:uncharacterized protein YcbX